MTLAEFLADPLRVTQISDSVLEIENRPVRRAVIAAAVILVAIAAAWQPSGMVRPERGSSCLPWWA